MTMLDIDIEEAFFKNMDADDEWLEDLDLNLLEGTPEDDDDEMTNFCTEE